MVKNKKAKKGGNGVNLTAIVIAKDEEEKIVGCLKSINWVDEIILIDTGSRDKTVKIAKEFGARIFRHLSGSYDAWRTRGLREAKGRWVLYIDADERVTRALRKEISSLIASSSLDFSAFAIPRRNIILGRELRYGGWWPDYVKRLFRRDKIKIWRGELHEEPVFEGGLGHLKNPLLHLKHDNLFEMVEKTNKWSEIEARLMFEAGHPKMNIPRFCSAMFREFWIRMIKYKAFLDGSVGVIYALYQVFSRFISYAKLWEMQEGFESQNSKF